MDKFCVLLSGSLLTLAAFAQGQEQPAALVLLGKPYPQYQQAASAFAEEWKKATGTAASIVNFPTDEAEQRRLLKGRPTWVVGLGEVPTTWAIHQPEEFALAFTMVVDPDRLKHQRESSPMKGRRLNGVSIEVPIREQLAILLQLKPGIQRVGVLTQDPALREQVAELRRSCDERKAKLLHVELASTDELPEKLDQLLGQVDLLWSVADSNVLQPALARHIIGQCAARGVPLVGLSATFVKAGATVSFERDYREIGQLLARHCLSRTSETDKTWIVEATQRIVVSVNRRMFQGADIESKISGLPVQVAKY